MKEKMAKNPKNTDPVSQITFFQWIIGLAIVAVISLPVLHYAGVIDVKSIFNPSLRAYELSPTAIIGEEYSHDFSSELIPLLPSDSLGGPYTFYLDSGVGFYPMGLTLDIDGVLHGIPKATAGNFRVCVKDVSGKSACKTYHLDVGSKSAQVPTSSSSTSSGTGAGTLWEGTLSQESYGEMTGFGTCTVKKTANIKICMKRTGQEVTAEYNLYDEKEVSREVSREYTGTNPPCYPENMLEEEDEEKIPKVFSGQIDSSGNFNLDEFRFQVDTYTASEWSNPNSPDSILGRVTGSLSGDTMTFDLLYRSVYSEWQQIYQKETLITATKVSDTC